MVQQDQAERLRKLSQQQQEETIMASHLPSRSEYHKKKREAAKKKKKKKRKMQNPLIKILAFIFLLLPITIGLIYYYHVLHSEEDPVKDDDHFEQVEFE
ncbi:hypothetical protein LI012_01515 [Caldibacillus thermoamylovorans]|jgi:cytoskeletal protein RodZ|uniref:hypothetical protein n=1 Tax=Bacillaceae TaxID=186817 RepID=UPI000D554811|nr:MULTISPECIES: hypothetical protein [Caldibacillus]MCB5933772.1 hypothetical protein [Bacillus sp. DFI.2.34]AWI12733.1 hypothetical protein CQJ30_11560 [Caldibacillus thermoamylovorans]MCB7069143.1 hypothetical protein [Caldibacillus sp. 210928-DFI.2.22]MCB7072494.1 hypothetical protein [Caldibacillus sp. 210928-DFI.2.18]MCB7075506.1 hypothetical protein [Caldibacillus thermoamylovorans]